MPKRHFRTARTFAVFLAAALGLTAAAATALAGPARVTWSNEPVPPANRGAAAVPFTLHWAGITPLNGSYANNWKIPLNFGPAPIRQDVKILYSQLMGKWPHEGVHRLLTEPNLRAEHLAAVISNSAGFIDVPNWDGLIAIDMEQWYPVWERYPTNMKQLFRDAVKTKRPAKVAGLSGAALESAIKAEFDATVKDLYLSTLAELRRGWPKAKISWLGVPMMLYGGDAYVPPGQAGYGDQLPSNASRLNDQVQWLMDAQDFVCAYTGNWAIAVNPPEVADYSKCTSPADWNYKATVSNVNEAIRLARGKPVYGFCGTRYGQNWGLAAGKPVLRDLDLYQQFTAFMSDTRVAGIIYWDEHHNEQIVREWESYLAGRFNTAANDVATRWNRRLASVSEANPVAGWSAVGAMARAGRIAPPAYTAAVATSRFTTAVNAPRLPGMSSGDAAATPATPATPAAPPPANNQASATPPANGGSGSSTVSGSSVASANPPAATPPASVPSSGSASSGTASSTPSTNSGGGSSSTSTASNNSSSSSSSSASAAKPPVASTPAATPPTSSGGSVAGASGIGSLIAAGGSSSSSGGSSVGGTASGSGSSTTPAAPAAAPATRRPVRKP